MIPSMQARSLLVVLLLLVPSTLRGADPKPFESEVKPLLEKHCYKCHNREKNEGELNLARIRDHARATERPQMWERIVKRVQDKEMPPEGEPEMTNAERAQLLAWVASLPKGDDCRRLATDETQNFYPGHVMSRRLTRTEYNNSVRDLIGIDLRPGNDFPSDGSGGEGFDTTGDTLFTSAILMEKYFEAADKILDVVLPLQPPDSFPPEVAAARQRILIAQPSEQLAARDAARKVVEAFATRAFRRPVTDEEVERLLTMFDRVHDRGDGYEASVRLALKAILVSPHFLFLAEPEPEQEGVYRLPGYPLASRLSYFLWSTMPDQELLDLAADNRLHDDEVMRQQIHRMLKDPRARALGENFAIQWLNIEALGNTVKPDAEKYPEFDAELAAAMKEETISFFHAIFRDDRPLTDLLHADYTFVNERLARHYGIEGVTGAEMQRVSLADGRRGGIVTQASVLTASSYPLRTSPVLRGRFVLEELLGSRVPPPPPDAGTLPADDKPRDGLTLRQQFELHRTKAECASCHNRMDPLGFGLENFDAIGRWRDTLAGDPIDASGKLPSGESFSGPEELKKLLLRRKQEVLKHLTRKMLGYAVGRQLNRFDQCVIDDTMKALAANGDRASVLVEQIVLSYPFQHRYVKK